MREGDERGRGEREDNNSSKGKKKPSFFFLALSATVIIAPCAPGDTRSNGRLLTSDTNNEAFSKCKSAQILTLLKKKKKQADFLSPSRQREEKCCTGIFAGEIPTLERAACFRSVLP